MRIGTLAHTLAKSYLHVATRKRTVFLRGASGIGKTDVVYQLAAILKEHIENWDTKGGGIRDIRLSQFAPEDFRGVPYVAPAYKMIDGKLVFDETDKRTFWAPPSFWPEEGTAGIIFVDEITSAPPALQAVAYQLTNERRVGEYFLPEDWMIIAAGNRQSDRGVTFNIAAPLLNRMTIIDVDTVFDDWQEHAAVKGKRPEVISFVKSRIDLLHKFEGKGVIEQFPSPRGWFAVSDILDVGYDIKVRVELIKGAVGNEAAVSFEAHQRIYEQIPDLDKIESEPNSVDVPDSLDVRYCLAMGISARLSEENFGNFWKYLKRMPKELQTLAVKLAFRRSKDISKHMAFGEWAAANADAFKRS